MRTSFSYLRKLEQFIPEQHVGFDRCLCIQDLITADFTEIPRRTVNTADNIDQDISYKDTCYEAQQTSPHAPLQLAGKFNGRTTEPLGHLTFWIGL